MVEEGVRAMQKDLYRTTEGIQFYFDLSVVLGIKPKTSGMLLRLQILFSFLLSAAGFCFAPSQTHVI